jgi:hypothetical protein
MLRALVVMCVKSLSCSINHPLLMEPEDSLLYSQECAILSLYELDESSTISLMSCPKQCLALRVAV